MDGVSKVMAAELQRMAERYADGSAPEPGATIEEWLAWAVLRQQTAAEDSETPPPARRSDPNRSSPD